MTKRYYKIHRSEEGWRPDITTVHIDRDVDTRHAGPDYYEFFLSYDEAKTRLIAALTAELNERSALRDKVSSRIDDSTTNLLIVHGSRRG